MPRINSNITDLPFLFSINYKTDLKIFTTIRVRLARYFLGKLSSRLKRQRQAINLDQAGDIGIAYSLLTEEEYAAMGRFVKSLQDKGKKVQVLGYYKGKKAPVYYAPKLAYDLLLNSDLDILLRPVSEFSDKFIDYPFDLLIDLSSPEDFPLAFVVELSKAGFKVGQGKPGVPGPFDLLIESATPLTVEELIKQVVHYTSTIEFISPPTKVTKTSL